MKGLLAPKVIVAHLAALAVLAALGGAIVIFGGLYNVSARLGHLPGVAWVLHTTFRNSVELYAPEESRVPADLHDPGRIILGAGHFEQACRFCHAAPGDAQNRTAQAMKPQPPRIEEAVAHWEPNHLFWIVHEGVKMSGMPQWPTSGRGDGVWNVVAFLMAVKDGMTREQYDKLLGRDGRGTSRKSGRPAAAARCVMCHGDDGVGRAGPFVPRLDIQDEPYLAAALEAYRQGTRQSGFMAHAASVPTARQLRELAEWYGAMQAGDAPKTPDADPELLQRGEMLAFGRDPRKNVPACVGCHGPRQGPRGPLFPALAGQYRDFLSTQLHAFRKRERGGTDRATLMNHAAHDLADDQIEALAAWYAAQPARKAAMAVDR